MILTLAVDTGDDYQFATTYTGVILSFACSRGALSFWSRSAYNSDFRARLSNLSGDFLPFSSSPLQLGRFVRVLDAAGNIVFTGILDDVSCPGDGRAVSIQATGRVSAVSAVPVQVGMFEDATLPDVVLAALAAGRVPNPQEDTSGRPYCELDSWLLESSVLAEYVASDLLDLSPGLTTYDLIGDNWASATVGRILDEITTAEWGFLAELRDGTIAFRNRHEILQEQTGALHTVTQVQEQTYDNGAIINEVQLRFQARSVVPNATLWTAVAALRFPPGTSAQVVSFISTDGRVLGARDVTADIEVYDSRTGGAVVGKASIVPGANSVGLVVYNTSADSWYVQAGAAVSGTARVLGSPVELVLRDEASINRHGRHPWAVPLPAFADEGDMIEVAKIGLSYAQPLPRLIEVMLVYQDAIQLAVDLLDRVALTVAPVGVSAIYLIVGIVHDGSSQRLRTRLILRELGDLGWLVLDDPERGLLDSNKIGW